MPNNHWKLVNQAIIEVALRFSSNPEGTSIKKIENELNMCGWRDTDGKLLKRKPIKRCVARLRKQSVIIRKKDGKIYRRGS